MNPTFVSEAEAYALLARAGWSVPRHGWLEAAPPFVPGDHVVLKGLGDDLWHKSELGAVRFAQFDPATLAREADGMRDRVIAAGHRWLGALVCERVALARAEGLPTEGFVSLSHHEAGWIALVGCGGLQADALAAPVPPLRWPLDLMTPVEALAEFEQHLLGHIWLGTLRGTTALTTRAQLAAFVQSIWTLAEVAGREGVALLELNPVVLDAAGQPRPLDAVGRRLVPAVARQAPPADFLTALTDPRSVALAGVSAQPDGVGRTILEKLQQCPSLRGAIVIIKPGGDPMLGVSWLPDVAALRAEPVDLLLLALPAAATAQTLAELIAQGGGARVVALVAGGLGDGADTTGLGDRIAAELHAARAAGGWTPAVLGPNFLGHWVPGRLLDTSFIPAEKLAPPLPGGPLVLLAQSGAFILCRRSRNPRLRFGLAVSLGNQLDAALPDFLLALAGDKSCRAIGAYVEGFAPGQLAATVRAALQLRSRGVPLVMLRAGRTASGQAAAASHTGAMAGDLVLEEEFLRRAGVKLAGSMAAFDAAIAWLSAFPDLRPGPVAFVTNAGVEAVNASDLATPRLPAATLSDDARRDLASILADEKLAELVAPRLPLDLTPMARLSAFLRTAELLLQGDAAVLLVGLVPFTRNIDNRPSAAVNFACALAALARAAGKPAGLIVDAGGEYEGFRTALGEAGLPVFTRVEDAIAGLNVLV